MTVLGDRGKPGSNHSFIASCFGTQGCYLKGTKITTFGGLKNIEDIRFGDFIWAGNAWRVCVPIIKGRQKYKKIILRNNQVLNVTSDHVVQTARGWVAVKDLVVGDSMVLGNVPWSTEWNDDSKKAVLVAMIMADGHLDTLKMNEKNRYRRKRDGVIANRSFRWSKNRLRFYKSDESLRGYFQNSLIELGLMKKSKCEYIDYGTRNTKVVCIQNKGLFDWFVSKGVPIGRKSSILKIPDWILENDAAMNGFLAGYFACDGSFYKDMIEISSCSEDLIHQMMSWLQSRGVVCRINVKKKNKNRLASYRLIVRNRDSIRLWLGRVPNISDKKIVKYRALKEMRLSSVNSQLSVVKIIDGGYGDVFDLSVDTVHEYLADGLVTHNSGKSYLSMTLCKILDPNFTVDNIYFDYRDLIYNRANLKPGSAVMVDEQSEEYGIDSHRINIILGALKEQLRKKSIHFIFCAPVLKDEYHCLSENSVIPTNKGYVELSDVEVGDIVLDECGNNRKIVGIWKKKKDVVKIKTDFGGEVVASNKHRFLTDKGLKLVEDICVGDFLNLSGESLDEGNGCDYFEGFFHGAFLADGTINDSDIYRKSKYTGKRVHSGRSYFLRISNNDVSIRKYLMKIGKKIFGFSSIGLRESKDLSKKCSWIDFYGKDQIVEIQRQLGKNIVDKRVPYLRSRQYALGLLNGFASCDSGWSMQEDKYQVSFGISSSKIAYGLVGILHSFGIYPTIRRYDRIKFREHFILYIPSLQVDIFKKLLNIKNGWKLKSLNKLKKKNFIPGNYKKIDKPGFCKVLSVEDFGKANCIDIEVDSKNHLFQVAGGLVSHNSSMYVIETMFIDYKDKVCFAAYKTRDLLTLGYVRIPHPLKFLSPEFIEAYELKKDAHLDKLTGVKQVDEIEEIAEKVVTSDLFARAEAFYVKKIGYISASMVVQIINKLYPEFKSSIIVGEVAARIKLNKELDGKWVIPYMDGKKKKKG